MKISAVVQCTNVRICLLHSKACLMLIPRVVCMMINCVYNYTLRMSYCILRSFYVFLCVIYFVHVYLTHVCHKLSHYMLCLRFGKLYGQ